MTRTTFMLVGVATVALIGACSDSFPDISSTGPARENYTADLSGAGERPAAITTSASGRAFVTFLDTNRIRVETWISNISGVTTAHIHADTNPAFAGPVMVTLLSNVAAGRPAVTGTDRVLSVVEITPASTFSNAFTFADLVTRIKNGTAYINVHTTANPGGEILGIVEPQP